MIMGITWTLLESVWNPSEVPYSSNQYTEVRFVSFLSGEFTTIAVINPPERKLEKRTTVHWYVSSNQLNLIGLGLLGMILLRIFHMY